MYLRKKSLIDVSSMSVKAFDSACTIFDILVASRNSRLCWNLKDGFTCTANKRIACRRKPVHDIAFIV